MVYSALATSIMYVIVKYLKGFSVYQIIFFRSLGTLAFTIPLLLKYDIPILGNNKKLLILRACIGLISMIFFFKSIFYLDLGISVSIRYTSPIFATLFAIFFLKEKVKIIQWIFLFVSIIGIAILKKFSLDIDINGFIYALISALSLGIVFVINRKIGNSESTLVIINYFMICALIFSGLMTIESWINPTFNEFILLLSSGFFGYVGLLFLTKSFQKSNVNTIAPLKYFEVIFTIIFGVFWFNETYTIGTIIGFILILIGISYTLFKK